MSSTTNKMQQTTVILIQIDTNQHVYDLLSTQNASPDFDLEVGSCVWVWGTCAACSSVPSERGPAMGSC